jgi:hypothetical protein
MINIDTINWIYDRILQRFLPVNEHYFVLFFYAPNTLQYPFYLDKCNSKLI